MTRQWKSGLQLNQLIIAFSCILLAVAPSTTSALEKWSRQIEEGNEPGQADSFADWVPLAQPVDGSGKEREARVLTYSQSFPPNGRFGEFQKPPQQQFSDYPFQLQRFPNAPHQPQQPQQLRQHSAPVASALKSQEPTSQSFFKFEMPYRGDGNNRQGGQPPTLQTGYQIQHTFGGGAQATLFNSPFYNQQPVFPPEFHAIPQKPLQQSLHKQKPSLHHQNFIEDTIPLKSSYRESKPHHTQQQTLQSVTPQVFPVDPQPEPSFELNKPTSFQAQPPPYQSASQGQTAAPTADAAAQQEVQLLYVPYDTLYNQQQQQQQQQPQGPTSPSNSAFEVNKFNFNAGLPAVNPYQINQFYTQDPLAPQEPNFYATSSTTSRPPLTSSLKPNSLFQDFLLPQTTTPKPKPKAHQPPLAMFLARNSARPSQSDVVATLRNAHTISVVDAPTKSIPEIFVGPAGMPTPDGYVKFDLPYLSQLTHSRDLGDVPFFVAPLSYRTPNGFHKILLPEPHVGSIVINRAKDNIANTVAYSPDVNQYQTNAPRTRPTTQHRIRPTTQPKDFYPDITTQRATLQPTRGNKFNYYYDQDQAIQEITSPKVGKHDRPKKKRPQTVTIEQPNFGSPIGGPYKDYRPTSNQLENENFYKLQPNKPTTSSTSTSTTSTSTTTSTTSAPSTYFTYPTSPQVEFQSTNGQLYHDFNSVKTQTNEPEYAPRFTTRPPPATSADDEYQMKHYFRQQDAFRNRPHLLHTTNSPFEQVQYTPVQLDYDRELNNIPTTTDKTTTTTKHRVTYYTPAATPATPAADNLNTLPPRENVGEYGSVTSDIQSQKVVPSNHRPSYNQNEILDGTVEYEPNPYQLPSELPPLAPNLPGLVNNLQDKSKLRPSEESTTTSTTLSEPEPPTRPTRRPINRLRKPVVTKVTSSVSYSESETSSRKPSRPERVRRPYGTRGSASTGTDSEDTNDSSSTTTRRPSSARNPLIRNPNRIRYQPTNEERQSLRGKTRKHGSKKGAGEDEDIDYQRDVLKQNYPVFKGRKPTSPTAIPSSYAVTTTEGATSETQQVYTVTPSNNIDQNEQTFPAGLLEPMQIAQQYNKFSEDNYGPGYFPNQEDLNPTEPVYKNEVNPVFTTLASSTSTTTLRPRTTTTTTTTEEPTATTRRSPFIRRNYPRPRLTTTEAPTTTTTSAPEERSSTRPRIPPRKVIKVRTRTRRPPHPASSTNAPEEETPQEETKSNYRKLSRFNSDLYENDTPRRRNKYKFQLEGQESQWSPPIKSQNHFQPLSPKEAAAEDDKHKFEEEPEIVTADPDANNEPVKKADTYEVNVSANFGSADSAPKTTIKAPNLKPEKSFAELLEEVMGKAPEEQPLDTDSETRTTDGTYFESQRTTIADRFNRRGKWQKKSRTTARTNESFETAESQNLGTQLFNSLNAAIQADKATDEHRSFKSTTPMVAAITEEPKLPGTTTPTPQTTADGDYQLTTTTTNSPQTTPRQIETTTNGPPIDSTTTQPEEPSEQSALDDLETQPSLFSEVKKQLHDLFAIDDNEDDRAVTAALAAVGRRRQEYTSIKRERPPTTTTNEPNSSDSVTTESTSDTASADGSKKEFHKNLMDHVVYATSTSTKVTSETEICYRGRCVRSEDLPANHKLN